MVQVAQVCAYELGIPMDMVKVKATDSLISANSATTGGSITTENCCEVIIQYVNKKLKNVWIFNHFDIHKWALMAMRLHSFQLCQNIKLPNPKMMCAAIKRISSFLRSFKLLRH